MPSNMKPSTRDIIRAALRADETVPLREVESINDLLQGKSDPAAEKPLLLNAKNAARLLGVGRTSFWEIVTADEKREKRLLQPAEPKPGQRMYRRKDIEAYADRVPTDTPVLRKQKIMING